MSSPSPAHGPPTPSRRWPEHARADFYVGKQVDQFYLRRRIGQGGMACVYLAEDTTRRCEVAVKILSRLDMGSRFEHEITLLSTVEHPNLVPVLAAGTTADDDPYLVEPFLAGVDLRDVLASGPLPWRVVLEIGAQVADALHALHVAGVIHRDVKPSNIMKVEGGPQPVWVRLIDLGHAKVTERWQPPALHVVAAPERHKTRTGVVLGSPGYIPPEAAQGVVDPRFDVFSLGVTLYQLCTGALPYTEGFERPRAIRETCPEVPQDLEDVILKAIAPEPAARWSSAELMGRALEAVRLANPVERSLETLFAGSFDLLGTLGIGATGTVFRAHHRRLCRPAALKVLTRGVQAEHDDRIRFDREAKILGLLDHPCVPRLFEYGIVGGQAYMAMELCKGKPIGEFCQPDRHLNPAQVISIGTQLAGALEAVHAVGAVYRDLSTSNVLVDFGEAGPIVRLIDFNHALVSDGFFARLDERYATPPELRRHPARELRLDKMDYSAPELRAGRPATPASDVYALGVLLYRALTGRLPIAPGTTVPKPASRYCKGCPESLEEMLRRALNPTPEARLTLAQVRTYLRDACEELDGQVQAETSGESIAKPVMDDAPSGTAASATASPARDTGRPRTGRPAVFVALLVAGLIGWLIGQIGRERTGDEVSKQEVVSAELEVADADGALCEPSRAPDDDAVCLSTTLTSTGATAALPPMRVALDGAAAGLRRCAEQAGGLLFVEFSVQAGRSEFSSVVAGNNASEAIHRCVTEAARSIRFQPTASQVFTEEYTP